MKIIAMKNILFTSLVADALSLGSHWIYSQREIAEKFGATSGYSDPATSYHQGKLAGDFTHYGDQTMVLLRSLALNGCFDLPSFANEWRAFWESPETQSYRDGATKATLANLRSGLPPSQAASPSNDIAGAARIAPLFLLKWKSNDDLIAAAKAQNKKVFIDFETGDLLTLTGTAEVVWGGEDLDAGLLDRVAQPHPRSVHRYGIHAHEGAVFQHAAMEDGGVANQAILAD